MSQSKSKPLVRKGYIDGPYGQVHYYEAGAGPTLILSHQSPTSARAFERALPHLAAAGLHAVAVDTPGYGNSDVPRSQPSIADYADVFPALMDGLDLKQAHLLGHHTGAAILANFVARYPSYAESLILNGPPLLSKQDLELFKDLKLDPPEIHQDGSHLQQNWDTRLKYSPGWSDKIAMHRRLVDQLWSGETAWYGHRAAFQYDMMPDLMALTCPVLILTNTGDDIFNIAKKVHALRPDFAYQELKGGTHDIVDEQPAEWSKLVAQFVFEKC